MNYLLVIVKLSGLKEGKKLYPEYFNTIFDLENPNHMHVKLPNWGSKQQTVTRFKKGLAQFINNTLNINKLVIVSHRALIGSLAKLYLNKNTIVLHEGKKRAVQW